MNNIENKKRKITVVGIDSATWNVISPEIKAGRLNNVKDLMSKGCYGDLRSTIPPITPVAWTSIATGKNPGKHGIFDFLNKKRDSLDMSLVNSRTRKSKTVWEILGECGYSIGVVTYPFTYPVTSVNGVMITGFPTPYGAKDITYPKYLVNEIKNDIGNIKIDYSINVGLGPEELLKEVDLLTESKENIIRWLLSRYDFDVFMVVFMGLDAIQHSFWKYKDNKEERFKNIISDYYDKYDKILGWIFEKRKNDYFFVVSDHGMCSGSKYFHLNQWLFDKGYLSLKPNGNDGNSIDIHSISRFLFSNNTIKRNINYLTFLIPKKYLNLVRDRFRHDENVSSIIDTSKTVAYSLREIGQIYINSKNVDDYKKICDNIIKELYTIKDPDTNEFIITKAIKKEDVLKGEYSGEGADIYLIFKDMKYNVVNNLNRKKTLFSKSDKSGMHDINGIFLISGKGIKNNLQVNATVYDIAPTILHIAGVKIPKDMDGRALTEIFDEEFESDISYQKQEKVIIKNKVQHLKRINKLL